MEFVHQHFVPGETVAAVATPPGEGGVAIVRISGNHAFQVASQIFSGPIESYKTHTAHYGQIKDLHGKHVDDVLILVMRGTRSYTGEDTVEIHCHGGSLITRHVLEVVLSAGARAARPGEFTFKAFMNGKIDLTQAEAVQELIHAKNDHALNAAEAHLKGALSQKIILFQQRLTNTAAILEAWVDFPEEGLEFATVDEICASLESVCKDMASLANTFHDGKIIHDGITMCLVGCPNVGKSSLMNALLDKERAIVSHIPGTTRDVLEDHMRLNGLNFRLMDTAGIRQADDAIEIEGIRRSKEAMNQADLVLLVMDASRDLQEEDQWLLDNVPKDKTILIWNKSDLPQTQASLPKMPHWVQISAKQRSGLDLLHKEIDAIIWKKGPPSREEVMITNVRHKESLENAIEALKVLINGLRSGVSPEFLSMEMRYCLTQLGLIIGTNISEDILSAIFSKFCIGK